MSDVYDVFVIGGGIVGAGVARDAAMRGLRVKLVDRADFASGTSSRSSRLLHGGLRYLAQGRVGLVREASREKMTLARIAPHLTQPLPFLFPTRQRTEWQRWKLSIGVRIYDLLCGAGNLGRCSTLSASEMLAMLPGLERDRLTGGVRYFDAFTSDARLVIDTLRSAVAHGASIASYSRLVGGRREAGLWICTVVDERTGAVWQARAKSVVNAAGAWASRIPFSRVRLRLTKGVHLVIDRKNLPVPEAVVLPAHRRILFVIPWGERVIAGTTDTDFAGDLADPGVDPQDTDYILTAVNQAFPGLHLTPRDVVSAWAGVRPLIAPRRVRAGAPSDISRSHAIRMTLPGWFVVAGGKLTTYRLMAEQTVERIGEHWNTALPASRTGVTPLVEPPPRWSGLLPPPFTREVAVGICAEEWPEHLDDLMCRRTSWHSYHGFDLQMARTAAEWMAVERGWNAERTRQELRRYANQFMM
jgi:glycerol-3-phosphate dehydrogenase